MNTLVRRYAESLYQAAAEEGALDAVSADVLAHANRMAQADYATAVVSPQTTTDEKLAVLLSHPLASNLTKNFFQLVLERRREEVLAELPEAFAALQKQHSGVVVAQVTSAIALTDAGRADLQKHLESFTGKQIELELKVDAALLGGLVIEMDGKRYDGSVSRKLDGMRQALMV